jgi:hypothetical protein
MNSLHQAFYGMAYTPFHAQAPQCGAVQANVTEDIQLLSQLTSEYNRNDNETKRG